jgi:hypothetical protein
MRAHYGPNVFISVLAVRGRVTAPAPTAFVDLGKPTFRLGYTMLQVGTDANRLSVDVKADAAVYPTRGKAQVVVSAKRADGTPAAGAEIAMVAVDDALLELAPNDTWDVGAVLTGAATATGTHLAGQMMPGSYGMKLGAQVVTTAAVTGVGRRSRLRRHEPGPGPGGAPGAGAGCTGGPRAAGRAAARGGLGGFAAPHPALLVDGLPRPDAQPARRPA